MNLATQLPSPLPATAGLLCFGRYVETLGEPAFLAPPSNAEKKAAKEARRREKEAAKEAARKKAEAAAAEAEANKGETPAEKKTRLAREDKVKQMLFDLDQSVQTLSADRGATDAQVLKLTQLYHNLVRRWAQS